MIKLLMGMLACVFYVTTSYAAVSLNTAQDILNSLTSANGMKPIKLELINEQYINAFGSPGYVGVTAGLLNYGNTEVLVYVLSHELGHAKGISSEVGADQASVKIAQKAGLDVCPGAKQFLLSVGKTGDGTHPPGGTRLDRMGCKPI